MRTVAWVRGIGKLTGAELDALYLCAERVGTHVDNMAAVQAWESDLNPKARNKYTRATGAIQFMPKTAIALGTTIDALYDMSFVEQQEYVVKYFAWFKGPLDTLEKLYCAVFWPAAIHKSDDFVIATADMPAYKQNAVFDRLGNKDGKITRAEICKPVRDILKAAAASPRIEIPEPELFTPSERAAQFALIDRTSTEATEAFRKGAPAGLDDDDEPPPTMPAA